MKWILSVFLFINIFNLQAHQPDLSSTMLIEREDNSWILQVRAAMTAFEYEVAAQFPETTFKSAEEFQELVIKHLKSNLSVRFNNNQESIALEKPYVKLGHETNVLFELKNVPSSFDAVFVKNSSFKDINRNQSGLVIIKEGFSKQQFILNNLNDHSVELEVSEKEFILKSTTVLGGLQSSNRSLLVIAVVSIGMLLFFWFKSKTA